MHSARLQMQSPEATACASRCEMEEVNLTAALQKQTAERTTKVNISPVPILSFKLHGLAFALVTCDTKTDNRLGCTLTLSGLPLDCSNLIPLFDSHFVVEILEWR